MLGYFPTPYPDELLYSIIARYSIHCGIHHSKELVSELFANRNAAAVVDLPGHIGTFVQQIGHLNSNTPWDWIQCHTLYPAFLAFVPPDRRERILQSAYSDHAGDIHTRIGLVASSLRVPKYLKICKQCYLEQKQKLGEAYWQRTLQMPGVLVCPFHEQSLFFTDAPQHPCGKFSFIPAEQSNIIGRYDSPVLIEKKPQLVQLARSYHELLNSRHQFDITFGQLSHYYHWLASHSNLIRRKRVDHQAVAEKFMAYWSRDCLLFMDVSLIPVSSWLTTLFRKHRKAAHPLYHLLIWQALGEYHPVVALEMIARMPKARVSSLNESVQPDSQDKLQEQRAIWLTYCDCNLGKGVKWLRTEGNAGANYAWLYRNDRDWLRANSPSKIKRTPKNNRVDWDARDKQILNELIELKNKVYLNNVPFRMTKTWYIKHVELNVTLEKHMDKLPLCKDFIDENRETVEQFHRRRISDVIAELRSKKASTSLWNILRKAGIRKQFVTNELLEFIKETEGRIVNGIASSDFSTNT